MEALSSKGDGTLTVVKEDSPTSFRVEQMVPTPARAKTLTLDTKTNQFFWIAAEYGPVPAAPAQTAPRPADRVHCFRRIAALTLHERHLARSVFSNALPFLESGQHVMQPAENQRGGDDLAQVVTVKVRL